MSVHQIDQYYIHMNISNLNTIGRLKTTKYLEENNISGYELQSDGFIVVDGFESVMDAEIIEHGIIEIQEDNKHLL